MLKQYIFDLSEESLDSHDSVKRLYSYLLDEDNVQQLFKEIDNTKAAGGLEHLIGTVIADRLIRPLIGRCIFCSQKYSKVPCGDCYGH